MRWPFIAQHDASGCLGFPFRFAQDQPIHLRAQLGQFRILTCNDV